MYVNERFELQDRTFQSISPNWGYGAFSEFIYYSNYSRRLMMDDVPYGQETWHDTVERVINGVMSIRKDWYIRNHILWDEPRWQDYAADMAIMLTRMEWTPPGRGLWAMGTDLVYERGCMPLTNCAYTEVACDWVNDLCWLMDCLMHGVGVGFGPYRTDLQLWAPSGTMHYVVPDTREGWVESVRLLLESFVGGKFPFFDYSLIRPEGTPIKTFGGVASGPAPLIQLHDDIVRLCHLYIDGELDEIVFKCDLANVIGVRTITGNTRRGAEIGVCDVSETVFGSLKDYKSFPHRSGWGWMSNNSYRLVTRDDFKKLPLIAQANIEGCDLGYINQRNIIHGRIGKFNDRVRMDTATGMNPCSEIPLESREVCNLAETAPTRCTDHEKWLEACKYATFYASTVTLLPTHQPTTNAVVVRNRRIGVSIVDFIGWKEIEGVANVTSALREGYENIRATNRWLAEEAGIPTSIRVTTVKPGGTVPKMLGRLSGVSHPTFNYMIVRVNVRKGTPVESILKAANIPYEDSYYTPDTTTIFEFPLCINHVAPATDVSIWEQAMNVVLLQREWADNAVSNTLYFRPRWRLICQGNLNIDNPSLDALGSFSSFASNLTFLLGLYGNHDKYQWDNYKVVFDRETDDYKIYLLDENHEENQIEAVLSSIAPLTKSVSLLAHSSVGLYKQMPQEGITREEYERRVSQISEINWSSFTGDGEDEKFCVGDRCSIIN